MALPAYENIMDGENDTPLVDYRSFEAPGYRGTIGQGRVIDPTNPTNEVADLYQIMPTRASTRALRGLVAGGSLYGASRILGGGHRNLSLLLSGIGGGLAAAIPTESRRIAEVETLRGAHNLDDIALALSEGAEIPELSVGGGHGRYRDPIKTSACRKTWRRLVDRSRRL